MDCSKFKEYLYLFIDGEIDSQSRLLVKQHIAACPLCNLELEQEKKIDYLIRHNIPKDKASFQLKEAVIGNLNQDKSEKVKFLILPLPKPVLAVSLIVLLTVALAFPILIKMNKPFPLFTESVSDHIKFLQGNLPIEIASNDPQDVNSWFQGKFDFHVKVPDYSDKGVQLLGGRLCSIKDKPVAYIMYKKEGYNFSLFMFDAAGLRLPKVKKLTMAGKDYYLKTEKGYHSLFWIDEGIGCILVSDLDVKELFKIVS